MIRYKGKVYRNPWHAASMTRTAPHKIYTEWKKAKEGKASDVTLVDDDITELTLANLALENLRRQIKFHTDAGFTPEHSYTARVLNDILHESVTQLQAIQRTDR